MSEYINPDVFDKKNPLFTKEIREILSCVSGENGFLGEVYPSLEILAESGLLLPKEQCVFDLEFKVGKIDEINKQTPIKICIGEYIALAWSRAEPNGNIIITNQYTQIEVPDKTQGIEKLVYPGSLTLNQGEKIKTTIDKSVPIRSIIHHPKLEEGLDLLKKRGFNGEYLQANPRKVEAIIKVEKLKLGKIIKYLLSHPPSQVAAL